MEMKIPYYMDCEQSKLTGMLLLCRIRSRFAKRSLPVIVFTEEKKKFLSSGLNLYDIGANELLQYDSQQILNNKIDNKFQCGFKDKIRNQLCLFPTWLTCSREGGMVVWKTISMTGRERTCRVKYDTIRCRLLDCFRNSLHYMDIIEHREIRQACEWGMKEFYGVQARAYTDRKRHHFTVRGPLKNHLYYIKKELGIEHAWLEISIQIFQPKD